jgi:type IV pilus assembly protein PilC
MLFVIPQFKTLFTSFGADLPAFTLMVMGLSDFMQVWWFVILLAIIASVYIFKELRIRSVAFG